MEREHPLSLVMLFGDLDRWNTFAEDRYREAVRAGIFSEIVFVLNRLDDETVTKVIADIRANFEHLPVRVLFRNENNIPAGRNAGIEETRTERVLIWDDDDAVQPEALAHFYKEVFIKRNLSLLELPLAHPDGREFHPQSPDLMPQIVVPRREELLAVGMVHTPYLVKRSVLSRVPLPEFVPLRGDWLHWSVLLWRRGIPIYCLRKGKVATEGSRPRDKGATASITPNDFACKQAFISLLFLFAMYDLKPDGFECWIVRRRYFNQYCANDGDSLWKLLMEMGKSLSAGRRIEVELPENDRDARSWILQEAYGDVIGAIDAAGGVSALLREEPLYDVGPFGMFHPSRQSDLLSIIS